MEFHCGMILTGKTEELGEKPFPVPLCPPQIPHGLKQARTRASAVIDNIYLSANFKRSDQNIDYILLHFSLGNTDDHSVLCSFISGSTIKFHPHTKTESASYFQWDFIVKSS
jgi:hypothetical protein